jgi:transcriptional regulator GlxA family with amidase domain
MAYFQTLRLNAARAALKGADPVPSVVQGIAEASGFRHFGKFAAYYRRLFGELPSRTVRRKK